MPANFDRSTALGTLLGPTQEKKIVTPKFQRSYSWEKSHISTFVSDIIDFHRGRRSIGADAESWHTNGTSIFVETGDFRDVRNPLVIGG